MWATALDNGCSVEPSINKQQQIRFSLWLALSTSGHISYDIQSANVLAGWTRISQTHTNTSSSTTTCASSAAMCALHSSLAHTAKSISRPWILVASFFFLTVSSTNYVTLQTCTHDDHLPRWLPSQLWGRTCWSAKRFVKLLSSAKKEKKLDKYDFVNQAMSGHISKSATASTVSFQNANPSLSLRKLV